MGKRRKRLSKHFSPIENRLIKCFPVDLNNSCPRHAFFLTPTSQRPAIYPPTRSASTHYPRSHLSSHPWPSLLDYPRHHYSTPSLALGSYVSTKNLLRSFFFKPIVNHEGIISIEHSYEVLFLLALWPESVRISKHSIPWETCFGDYLYLEPCYYLPLPAWPSLKHTRFIPV